MSLYLLRVVLRSGSLTEMTFDTEASMRAAVDGMGDNKTPTDDYGITMMCEHIDIAALIPVDFEAELRGQQLKLAARMRIQNEAQREVQREAMQPSARLLVPNGRIIGA